MNKQLSIETVQVEICVVRVGGHKMTLATFRQIPEIEYSPKKDGWKVFGWVKAPAPWPPQLHMDKDTPRLNPEGHWLLCVDPNGTLQKVAWPSLTAPRGKQIYMAT